MSRILIRQMFRHTLLACLLLLPMQAEAARILALSPHACEMLYAIGAGDQIVGAVSYCDYPAEANALPRIGSYERINVEAALRLKADVAIAINRNVGGVEQLEKLGVKIVISDPHDFEEIFTQLLQLGELTGHQEKAGKLVESLKQRLAVIRARPRTDKTVFYEVWHDPLMSIGGKSFISAMIADAGATNVFAGNQLDVMRIGVESVVKAWPEIIVLPEENRDIEERKKFWRHWLGDSIHFVSINPDLLHRPGPRLIDGLELLQKALADDAGVKQ